MDSVKTPPPSFGSAVSAIFFYQDLIVFYYLHFHKYLGDLRAYVIKKNNIIPIISEEDSPDGFISGLIADQKWQTITLLYPFRNSSDTQESNLMHLPHS